MGFVGQITYRDIFGEGRSKRLYIQKAGSEKVNRKNDVSLPVKPPADEEWIRRAKQSHQRLVKRAKEQ